MNDLSLLQVRDVDGRQVIVDSAGTSVRLRGVAIGGWMNMENFINGYPGAEHSLRVAMAEAMGDDRAAYFFDRWLDYYLAEEDIAFIGGLGANVVRLALNYRHFEDDLEPFVYKESGFELLDRALGWCAAHGIYAILDLHAVQGWQNPDWHSDNRHKHALLWTQRQFQDRFVALWEELARRSRGNPTVAAYDLINEPETRDVRGPRNWPAINALYRRAVDAIRRIDPDHIIVLEGDTFSSRFEGLDAPFAPNLVYSSHDYSLAGFGPGPYPGETRGKYRDRSVIRQNFESHRGTQFTSRHNVPHWVGEFGAVYNGPSEEIPDRLRALDDQIDVMEDLGTHWTIWTYKDVGVMGLVTLDPESQYMRLVAPILETKLALASDSWMQWLPEREARARVVAMSDFLHASMQEPRLEPETLASYLSDMVLSGYIATLLQPAWVNLFKDMTEGEIDQVLSAFSLQRCIPNQGLLDVLRRHFCRSA